MSAPRWMLRLWCRAVRHKVTLPDGWLDGPTRWGTARCERCGQWFIITFGNGKRKDFRWWYSPSRDVGE